MSVMPVGVWPMAVRGDLCDGRDACKLQPEIDEVL